MLKKEKAAIRKKQFELKNKSPILLEQLRHCTIYYNLMQKENECEIPSLSVEE